MTNISGMIACGQRGGPSFIETMSTRPISGICPLGYHLCSDQTSPTESVCLPPEFSKDKHCPILDVLVISDSDSEKWRDNGYQITEKGYPTSAESVAKIAFSKTTSRIAGDGPKEPIIHFTMNTFIPCMGYDYERLMLTRT